MKQSEKGTTKKSKMMQPQHFVDFTGAVHSVNNNDIHSNDNETFLIMDNNHSNDTNIIHKIDTEPNCLKTKQDGETDSDSANTDPTVVFSTSLACMNMSTTSTNDGFGHEDDDDDDDIESQQQQQRNRSCSRNSSNANNNSTSLCLPSTSTDKQQAAAAAKEEKAPSPPPVADAPAAAATVTVITNFDDYMGETLQEKIDSCIATHPVVMFNKTWCLFSIDAQHFLTDQMNVSIHSIEVDVHPQGKEILKYIQESTKHETVPIIFIKGEFLGGFEDVNGLYASGKLQEQYLQGLTQADRCEEFIKKAKLATQPLFWFPETVNAYVIRATGIMTCLSATLAAVLVHWYFWGRYIAYFIFFDFILRFFGGAKISVMGRMAILITSRIEPKPRHGRPKQFATMCGVMFSGLSSLAFLVPLFPPYHDYIGTAFMVGLAGASGMEGFLDFCVGCVIFKYGIQLGLIPK